MLCLYGYNSLYFYMLIITMHAHTISSYFYRHHYFTVCTLQVISLIVMIIQLIKVRNRKVEVVVCFDWIQFSYNSTISIFLLHSHSCFKDLFTVFSFSKLIIFLQYICFEVTFPIFLNATFYQKIDFFSSRHFIAHYKSPCLGLKSQF